MVGLVLSHEAGNYFNYFKSYKLNSSDTYLLILFQWLVGVDSVRAPAGALDSAHRPGLLTYRADVQYLSTVNTGMYRSCRQLTCL